MGNKLINLPYNKSIISTVNKSFHTTINNSFNNTIQFSFLTKTVKAFCIKNSNTSTNPESNVKKIKINAVLCQGWSLKSKKLQVLHLIEELRHEGFEVEYDYTLVNGYENELYVYKIVDGKRILIFSNNEYKHKDIEPFPIIGRKINESNIEDIIKKLH